jgi:hypothetical protein
MTADPFVRYRDDFEAFARERLRFEPWSKQIEIANAVRDHERTAVRACDASGKSATAGGLVPWWLSGGDWACARVLSPDSLIKLRRARENGRRCYASGIVSSGNGCSACTVPELAVSRLRSLTVDRLEIRRNFAQQAALRTGRNGGRRR